VSDKVVNIMGEASYENYFDQCNPESCQYFAEDSPEVIFFNALGTMASFFAVCMAIARFGYSCTHRPLVELSPDGYYIPGAAAKKYVNSNATNNGSGISGATVTSAEMTSMPGTPSAGIASPSQRTLLDSGNNPSDATLTSVGSVA
jgi:hypothetical protein